MELNGENILSGVFQSFVGTVVDVDKCRYGNLRIKVVRIYHVTVVLR